LKEIVAVQTDLFATGCGDGFAQDQEESPEEEQE
jgi:hypothetical protein